MVCEVEERFTVRAAFADETLGQAKISASDSLGDAHGTGTGNAGGTSGDEDTNTLCLDNRADHAGSQIAGLISRDIVGRHDSFETLIKQNGIPTLSCRINVVRARANRFCPMILRRV